VNAHVYDWRDGKLRRKSIEDARQLLAEAGYPDGRSAADGKPLLLHFDAPGGGPEDKALFDWYRKQFAKLNIDLQIRATDYNRFQDKMRNGKAQIFRWGWLADYPDPENFLFLLYGPNAKVGENGENAANYRSPDFDKLFARMKNMENSPQRQRIIHEMVAIAQRDAPWIWGMHPKNYALYHAWYHNVKPNLMANNTLKYKRLDPGQRARLRSQWNQVGALPFYALCALLVVFSVPAALTVMRNKRTAKLS